MNVVLSKRLLYVIEAVVIALIGAATWAHVLETWATGLTPLLYGAVVIVVFGLFHFVLLRAEAAPTKEAASVGQRLAEPMSTPTSTGQEASGQPASGKQNEQQQPVEVVDPGPLEVPASSGRVAAGSEEPTEYNAQTSPAPAAGSEEPTEYNAQTSPAPAAEAQTPAAADDEPDNQPVDKPVDSASQQPADDELDATEFIPIDVPESSAAKQPAAKQPAASKPDNPEAGTPDATERVDLAQKLATLVADKDKKKDKRNAGADDSPDKTTRVDISDHIDS